MIERLLTPGSNPNLVMRRCVLGKTFYANFQLGPISLSVVVAQPEERHGNRTSPHKKVLWLTEAECLVHTNKQLQYMHYRDASVETQLLLAC